MNKKPAYSLIFAFIMMTVIMVIATTTIQDTRNKLHLFSNLESSSQARLAAESAAELGIVALKDPSTYGYDSGTEVDEAFCADSGGGTTCQAEGKYIIHAHAAERTDTSAGTYFLPIPGTGNAAPSEDCSVLDAEKDVDHACNWDKLVPGESITIPMYNDDGNGTLIFPDTMGMTAWYLRLRTPCEDAGVYSEDCDGNDRYTISSKTSWAESSDNPTIVLWEFTAESSGVSTSMIPNDVTVSGSRYYLDNTEIYEGLIEAAPYTSLFSNIDNVVLAADTSSTTGYDLIYDFITDVTGSGYTDLIFNMSIVNALEDTSGSTIPYLEYQVVMESSDPSISPRAEIIGKGYYESGGDVYYSPYVLSSNNTDTITTLYTLSN
jgi:hypothetical protein